MKSASFRVPELPGYNAAPMNGNKKADLSPQYLAAYRRPFVRKRVIPNPEIPKATRYALGVKGRTSNTYPVIAGYR